MPRYKSTTSYIALVLLALGFFFPPPAAASEGVLDPGATSWILTSSALVLFMTAPGLALFYAGLVRTHNTLSVLMQCSYEKSRSHH